MEKGTKVEVSEAVAIAAVDERSWKKKKDGVETGETGYFWVVTFVGGNKVKTFSTTARDAFQSNIGEPVIMTIECTGQFKDEDEFKPLLVALADGTVIYDINKDAAEKKGGGGRRGGGGGGSNRPEWSYETPEERVRTRASIEAQVALKAATEIVVARIQFDNSLDPSQAVDTVLTDAAKFASQLRDEKSGSGIGSQGRQPGGSKTPAPVAGPSPAAAVPTPDPVSSSGTGWS